MRSIWHLPNCRLLNISFKLPAKVRWNFPSMVQMSPFLMPSAVGGSTSFPSKGGYGPSVWKCQWSGYKVSIFMGHAACITFSLCNKTDLDPQESITTSTNREQIITTIPILGFGLSSKSIPSLFAKGKSRKQRSWPRRTSPLDPCGCAEDRQFQAGVSPVKLRISLLQSLQWKVPLL